MVIPKKVMKLPMLLNDYSNQKEVYVGLYMKCYHTYYTFMCKNDSCCITIMTHSIAVPESLFIYSRYSIIDFQ